MPHVEDFLRVLDAHRGRPYHATSNARFGPNLFDCSGYMWFGLTRVGLKGIPTVSSTQARWCFGRKELSVAEGLRTRGALLFMGANRGLEGFGPAGHVAVSLGDGRCLETPAPGRVSGYNRATGRNWSGAGLVPGLEYGAQVAPQPEAKRKRNNLFAFHLKNRAQGAPIDHPDYPNGGLFVGTSPLGLVEVTLQRYADALDEGAFEVKVDPADFDLWMRFEIPKPVRWAVERLAALAKD